LKSRKCLKNRTSRLAMSKPQVPEAAGKTTQILCSFSVSFRITADVCFNAEPILPAIPFPIEPFAVSSAIGYPSMTVCRSSKNILASHSTYSETSRCISISPTPENPNPSMANFPTHATPSKNSSSLRQPSTESSRLKIIFDRPEH
jgi:hypothetical protein